MKEYDEYTALKIGALLHDIGKFLQRTTNKEFNGNHQTVGANFVEKNYEKFGIDKDIVKDVVDLIKEHHNKNKKTGLVGILRLADWLSSAERDEVEEGNNNIYKIPKEEQRLLSIFELIRLNEKDRKNIEDKISQIYIKGGKYGLQPLAINNYTIFPYTSPNPDYNTLYEKFSKELEETKIDNFKKLYQLIQKYFWCVPSATNWKKVRGYLPDISLYDHLKTTCAIACCLYQIYKENASKNEKADAILTDDMLNELLDKLPIGEDGLYDESNPSWEKYTLFSLIHGDISGIQKFIFKITSKYATKSLKGRSFYLDFLTEIVAKWICKELNLPITNILFYGGGHFYILSYKIKDNVIDEFEKKINNLLYEMFRTDLYITIAKVDIKPYEFLSQEKSNFSKKWKEVADETIQKKLRRFYYKFSEELFEPYGIGIEERCAICKNEITESEMHKLYDDEDGAKICKYCASFVELTEFLKDYYTNGKIDFNKTKIKRTDIVIEDRLRLKDIPAIASLIKGIKEYEGLNINFNDDEYFLNTYNLPDKNGELKIPFKIWSIAFPLKEVEDENGKIRKEIKDFDTLAKQAEERTGTNKIAILKMDVDNLGTIFTEGLGNRASLSRLSTLSSMLTLFFTGYIPYLIKKETFKGTVEGKEVELNYKDNIYLVYSGGDDTLIVGAWDAIWNLAKKIRKEFKRFVCYNPDITLSAGIVIINPKFEFKKAVNMAENELETGKEYVIYENEEKDEKIDKNALTIFNCPMNWDLEVCYDKEVWEKWHKLKEINALPEIYENILLKSKIEQLVEKFNEEKLEEKFEKAIKNTGKKRLLHISQFVAERLEKIVERNKNGEIVINLPYYWRTLYYLHRNYEKNFDYVKFLEEYLKDKVMALIKSDEQKIKFSCNDLKVSAKIIELKNRKG
ncbi:CRISPR-associated protein, Csm1 family [Methanocaldococcus sp. FS406-22]|uniref:type III-A CRISPR-associated protein Cas10/Csm1 n=1 Tax=Methanocaldococcus sp. (strain FS406-22) TaxID=644281 RepID=UPI0001BF4353|nr:type III-A CRISPR-associated protein Cas10/Csm1 [Methanocaldococcus sp. FS406-22]ADC69271.1 CRISPR-associated protein, Csm1 family [Methanocaldococcus sp. FS406-22]